MSYLISRIMEPQNNAKRSSRLENSSKRTPCPECKSQNTFESNKPKQGHYLYCNHCGHEHWDD